MKEKIAVIIVTYNGERWLKKCLECLFSYTGNMQVYIADNGSADNTVNIIESFHGKIDFQKLAANKGFGAANNICIKKAYADGCDYFMLLNQDVYISNSTIPVLIEILQKNPVMGIISPLHFNGDATLFDKNFLHSLASSREKKFVNDIYFKKAEPLYEVNNVNAACWMLPKKTIETIGGFDPLFFHYGEDDNYCQRVLYHGLKIAITTLASVRHDRDDRDGNIRQEYLQQNQERAWLIKVANVSADDNKKYERQLKELYWVNMLKKIITLRFAALSALGKEYGLKKKLLQQAADHRKINRSGGMNWL